MEKIENTRSRLDNIRQRTLDEFVDALVSRNDAELSYYSIILHQRELPSPSMARLIQTIASDKTSTGDEYAFRLLRDQETLIPELRDILLDRIVASGDKTTCDLVLQRISQLGDWEMKLREVLAS